jgi:hypothetical protein
VRIVEADQTIAIGIVQRERVLQPVWAAPRRRNAPDPEPEAVALIEPVGAPVEREKELQGAILVPFCHIISSYDM